MHVRNTTLYTKNIENPQRTSICIGRRKQDDEATNNVALAAGEHGMKGDRLSPVRIIKRNK